ncbi:MAG: hypothetical protein NWE81_01280 [Candidatus Bathyarchaeota archaeon]|nr:hypothetical protein [Candidatus Bathyarchaeota archaeon]
MGDLQSMLKVNPSEYVSTLKTPIGMHLRSAVLEKEALTDRELREELRRSIATCQSADGSWAQLFVHTANNLWNLALLGCDSRDESVRKGLDWLLSIQRHQYKGYPGFFLSDSDEEASVIRSTHYGEFGPGCAVFYQTSYAIHLFHVFGFDRNRNVQRTLQSFMQFWRANWCGAWCTINVLRVLAEHPLTANSNRVERGLKHLSRRQTSRGTWKGFPFYHTFHALSRSDNALARRQLAPALPLMTRRQNQDGSWGKRNRETKTYLALDALKCILETKSD